MVRPLSLGLLFLGLLASAGAGQPNDKEVEKAKSKSPGLAVGSNLPGPFQAYNVTGPHKGRFHCLVSDHGLYPAVLIFSREVELSDALKDLLQKLDNTSEKNPNVRLAVSVVFVPDELKDVVTDDDKREDLAGKTIEDLAKAAGTKNVTFALASKKDLARFGLDENASLTIVVYDKLQVLFVEALERDKLTAEKVAAVVKMVGEKIGAKKK